VKGNYEEQWFLLQAVTMKDGLLSLLCTHAVCAGSAQKVNGDSFWWRITFL
jgi:hypothetical protein